MRMLIVEDETGIANFLKQGFEEESFAVDVAEDGQLGLSMALSGEYDIVILDWMLPGLTGIEVCQKMRAHDKSTPVVFVTARDTVEDTIQGLKAGGNDFIKKPFHFEELLQRVRVQLRTQLAEHAILRLGPIEMDIEAHSVKKNDKEIYLTQKEFALLEMLIRNKGKVCTRTRIIQSVWDINFEYNTGVIDVFMNALRKKLELDEHENYLQTVRGVGYVAKEL